MANFFNTRTTFSAIFCVFTMATTALADETSQVCKALIVLALSAESTEDVHISDASEFSNPQDFETILQAEYLNPFDERTYRVLCGINSTTANHSSLLDNSTGRTQYEWGVNRNISYRVTNDEVTFTWTYGDGSQSIDTISLE